MGTDKKLTGNFTTAGIGSLPFTEPREAAEFVLEEGPDIPFWPQLPRRAAVEKMIPQYAAHMPCAHWDESQNDVVMETSDKYGELEEFYGKYLSEDPAQFALPRERAAGFYAFSEALESVEAPAAVKGQITGPLTFTTGVSDSAGRTLYGDPELRDAAVKMLERNACWQVRRLKELGAENTVVFADEPVLSAYGSSAYVGISEEDVTGMLSQIFNAVSDAGGISGMHVCGNSDWAMAMRSGVDVLNFDAYQYGTTLSLYAEELRHFLDRGGLIAWGIVPTTEDVGAATPDTLAGRMEDALTALESKGFDRAALIQHSLLTPSCGAGSLNKELARKVFSLLRTFKKKLLSEV